ncbi:MAG: hypothetical protein RI963_3769 [Planctomycetota bacterium]
MKRYLLGMFMSLVITGLARVDAADLSKAGGNWDADSVIEWVPAKLFSKLPEAETESPSLIQQASAMSDELAPTTMVSHQHGCRTGIPCDWLTPCGGWTFEFQNAWMRLQAADADNASGTQFDSGTRYIFGHTNDCGNSWRLRYFNYFTEGLNNDYKLEYIDFEHARRFTLGGSVYGELGAGLRWAEFFESFPSDLVYSDTIGPMVAAEIRGLSLASLDFYASGRHSIQFGRPVGRQFGSFSISELQLGVMKNTNILGHPTFVKGFVESQYWVGMADGGREDIGLIGLGFALGTTF